jgi:hypothetical protein
VQLFEWHPRVTPQTTVQDLLAIGPLQPVRHYEVELDREPRAHRRTAHQALGSTRWGE